MSVKPTDFNLNSLGNSPSDILDLNSSIISDKTILEYLNKNAPLFISENDLDKFKIKFNFLPENDLNTLIIYFKFFIICSISLKYNESYQFNFSEFNTEFNNRAIKLKEDLNKKYPFFNEIIENSFKSLLNSFNNEIKDIYPLMNKYDSHPEIEPLKNKKGRPNNIIMDKTLLVLNELAEKNDPQNKYPKIFIPFFEFIHQLNPELIDINYFNNPENLRKRIYHLNKDNPNKTKAGE